LPNQTVYHTPQETTNVEVTDDGDVTITIPRNARLTEEQHRLLTQFNMPRSNQDGPRASTGARQKRPNILPNVQDVIDQRARQGPPGRAASKPFSSDRQPTIDVPSTQFIDPTAYLPRSNSATNIKGNKYSFRILLLHHRAFTINPPPTFVPPTVDRSDKSDGSNLSNLYDDV
jgi:hypothetical protein